MSTTYIWAPDRLELPDLTLRSYEPGDGALLNEATQSSYDHLKTFMPWAVPELPVEESEKLVRRFRGDYLLGTNYPIGIFAPDGKRVLGGSGFHDRAASFADKSAEIGMWIRGDIAGKGWGTKSLVAMLSWGFTMWPWERLVWLCDSRNTASARTAEKAGMLREAYFRQDTILTDGTRRDTILFAALREEWLARHHTP